ncbi:MAG: cation diffusion facilitator family transporter [Gemmatimonadota bacterium]|nr:cation diffusion facilitator family transporter [Gemmatimonadota bacterium]
MTPPRSPTPPEPRATSDQLDEAYRTGTKATATALVVSALLGVVKITAGLVGNSFALVADGVESVLDLSSSLLVWSGLRASSAPQTPEFPYGRGKAEPLAALVVATVLLSAAAGIAYGAVREIMNPHAPPAAFTLAVLVAVVVTKEGTFRFLTRSGTDVGSRAMLADAWHHRADALTSVAAFFGISLALLLGEGWESADDWAALVACVVIAWNGVRLLRSGLREVLDAAAPQEICDQVRRIAARTPDVHGIDEVRVRRSGLVYLVDIHVEVDGALTVRRGHQIGHDVKDRLITSELPILDVLVHVEPNEPTPPENTGPATPRAP